MAEKTTIAGAEVKRQSPWGVLGLVLVTFGIYFIYWGYRVNREMRDIGAAYGDADLSSVNPALSGIATVVPIANLVMLHRTGTRLRRVQELTGRGADYSMGLHWLLAIFTGLWWAYTQHSLTSLYRWFDDHTRTATPNLPGAKAAEPVVTAGSPTGGPFAG